MKIVCRHIRCKAYWICKFVNWIQYIPNHLVVPSNQVAIWYGPIYVGRFTLNPFGSDFDPDGAGVLNMDLAGQGDNASLRIHNGSQIKIQAF